MKNFPENCEDCDIHKFRQKHPILSCFDSMHTEICYMCLISKCWGAGMQGENNADI
ncbi:MAG: hypothetical protein PHV37_09195 [Candidatus Gastranaerophilales bacterium]|nr:hypothetical protein [Candidatus Gastranaerophilales bacterium]